jgi:hypothetical protein
MRIWNTDINLPNIVLGDLAPVGEDAGDVADADNAHHHHRVRPLAHSARHRVHRNRVRGNLQRVRQEQVPLSHEHLGYSQKYCIFCHSHMFKNTKKSCCYKEKEAKYAKKKYLRF